MITSEEKTTMNSSKADSRGWPTMATIICQIETCETQDQWDMINVAQATEFKSLITRMTEGYKTKGHIIKWTWSTRICKTIPLKGK